MTLELGHLEPAHPANSFAELSGLRSSHKWKMKTLRDGCQTAPLKSLMHLIWGATESGTVNSKYSSNVGAHLAPPIQIKSQD